MYIRTISDLLNISLNFSRPEPVSVSSVQTDNDSSSPVKKNNYDERNKNPALFDLNCSMWMTLWARMPELTADAILATDFSNTVTSMDSQTTYKMNPTMVTNSIKLFVLMLSAYITMYKLIYLLFGAM